jgi:hypothetical protein
MSPLRPEHRLDCVPTGVRTFQLQRVFCANGPFNVKSRGKRRLCASRFRRLVFSATHEARSRPITLHRPAFNVELERDVSIKSFGVKSQGKNIVKVYSVFLVPTPESRNLSLTTNAIKWQRRPRLTT